MAEEFSVRAEVNGVVGVLMWDGSTDVETLARAVALAATDLFGEKGLRRLEVSIPTTDPMARHALHRAGFRREGRARAAMDVGTGDHVDIDRYARLDTDSVDAPDTFSSVMDTVLPTKRMIGHVFFRDGNGRVLLLETHYKNDWELPGGVVEPGEPPRVGAEREVLEELGLSVRLGAPALVDWLPPYLGWSDAVEFIWDGGVLEQSVMDEFIREEREITAIHWVAPEDVAEHVTPLSARRIALLVDGFRGFTEDGIPV